MWIINNSQISHRNWPVVDPSGTNCSSLLSSFFISSARETPVTAIKKTSIRSCWSGFFCYTLLFEKSRLYLHHFRPLKPALILYARLPFCTQLSGSHTTDSRGQSIHKSVSLPSLISRGQRNEIACESERSCRLSTGLLYSSDTKEERCQESIGLCIIIGRGAIRVEIIRGRDRDTCCARVF